MQAVGIEVGAMQASTSVVHRHSQSLLILSSSLKKTCAAPSILLKQTMLRILVKQLMAPERLLVTLIWMISKS